MRSQTYITLYVVSLIFYMPVSVLSEELHTRYVLMMSTVLYGESASISQKRYMNNFSYENETDCYKDLKEFALFQNTFKSRQREGKFRIEIIDETKIEATTSEDDIMRETLHCVKISLNLDKKK